MLHLIKTKRDLDNQLMIIYSFDEMYNIIMQVNASATTEYIKWVVSWTRLTTYHRFMTSQKKKQAKETHKTLTNCYIEINDFYMIDDSSQPS